MLHRSFVMVSLLTQACQWNPFTGNSAGGSTLTKTSEVCTYGPEVKEGYTLSLTQVRIQKECVDRSYSDDRVDHRDFDEYAACQVLKTSSDGKQMLFRQALTQSSTCSLDMHQETYQVDLSSIPSLRIGAGESQALACTTETTEDESSNTSSRTCSTMFVPTTSYSVDVFKAVGNMDLQYNSGHCSIQAGAEIVRQIFYFPPTVFYDAPAMKHCQSLGGAFESKACDWKNCLAFQSLDTISQQQICVMQLELGPFFDDPTKIRPATVLIMESQAASGMLCPM